MMSDPLLAMPDLPSKSEGQSQRPSTASFWDKFQTYLCIGLHLILVLAHVALVVVYTHHYEHHVTVETGHPANRLSTIITALSQTIGTVYAAILVLLTQQLALKRELHVRQTLSALHDKSSAWLGVGSSVLVLWSQLKVRTAPLRIVLIAVYLAGVFVFHITTPSLFNIVPYNVTTTVKQPTQLGRVVPIQSNINVNDHNNFFPEAIYSMLEILPLYPDLDTPGLLNSTLYDTIPVLEGATGEVTINATQFQVDCGALPNGSIAETASSPSPDGLTLSVSFVNASVGNSVMSVGAISLANPSLVVASTSQSESNETLPTIVVAATMNFTDSSGSVQSLHPLTPVVVLDGVSDTSTLYDQMQLLACNVAVKDAVVNVTAATGKLAAEPFSQSEVAWHDWQLPQPTSDPLLSIINWIPGDTPDGDQTYCAYFRNSSSADPQEACYNPTLFETFLQAYLTPPSTVQNTGANAPLQAMSDPLSNATASVAELNKVLSNAFATIYWYVNKVNGTRLPGLSGQPVVQNLAGEAAIQIQSLRSQLNLNGAPLYIGLATSIMLLALSLVLMGRARPSQINPELDTTGLLQLTWLVGQEPGIAERVAETDVPTQDNLRRAGLFEVDIGEGVSGGLMRRKTASTLHGLVREDL